MVGAGLEAFEHGVETGVVAFCQEEHEVQACYFGALAVGTAGDCGGGFFAGFGGGWCGGVGGGRELVEGL